MGFAVDHNNSNNQNKNFMKHMVPGGHLGDSLYGDLPGQNENYHIKSLSLFLENGFLFICKKMNSSR